MTSRSIKRVTVSREYCSHPIPGNEMRIADNDEVKQCSLEKQSTTMSLAARSLESEDETQNGPEPVVDEAEEEANDGTDSEDEMNDSENEVTEAMFEGTTGTMQESKTTDALVDEPRLLFDHCVHRYTDHRQLSSPRSPFVDVRGLRQIGFGKHCNQTYRDVVATDLEYCKWALRQRHPSPQLRDFVEYLYDRMAADNCYSPDSGSPFDGAEHVNR